MICRIHTTKGRSMSGLIGYLMHDKGRLDSSERVSWFETRNLATRDPFVAARVMTATALNADNIKRRAGVSLAGRKTDGYVLHYSLSWAEDEAEGLTKEDMLAAAESSLKVLGKGKTKNRSWRQFADEHQAVIVAHTDEKHPHCHVAVQMIHPETGRKLPTSNDQLKLSRWALKLEQDQGRVRCSKRRVNMQMRDKGAYVTYPKNKPRHVFELERANENHPKFDRIEREQKQADERLARKSEDLAKSHEKRRDDLDARNKAARQKIIDDGRRAVLAAKKAVRDAYLPKWEAFYERQDREADAFAADEDRLFGRAKNLFKTFSLKGVWNPNRRPRVLKAAFEVTTSSTARIERFRRQQLPKERALWQSQKREERAAVEAAKKSVLADLRRQRSAYLLERRTFGVQTRLENAKLRAEWRQRGIDRRQAWEVGREKQTVRSNRPGLLDGLDGAKQLRDYHARKDRNKGRDRDERGRGL